MTTPTVRTIGKEQQRKSIVPGEIVAYRAWNISAGGWLSSVIRSDVWHLVDPMQKWPHRPGIHAFKTPEEIIQQYGWMDIAVGEVYLWGDVMEHEKGFTAEYAKPKALYGVTRKAKLDALAVAREHYKAPWDGQVIKRFNLWQRIKKASRISMACYLLITANAAMDFFLGHYAFAGFWFLVALGVGWLYLFQKQVYYE